MARELWKGCPARGAHRLPEGALRGRGGHCWYLDRVLQLGVLVVEDAEAERLLGDHFHEHEVATLKKRAERGEEARSEDSGKSKQSPCL